MIIFVLLICRFELYSTTCICLIRKLKASSSGNGSSMLAANSWHNWTKSATQKGSNIVPSLGFHSNLFHWHFPDSFRCSKVIANYYLIVSESSLRKYQIVITFSGFNLDLYFFFFSFRVKAWNFGRFFITFDDYWFHGRHCYNNMLATTEGPVRIETFYYQNWRRFRLACSLQ